MGKMVETLRIKNNDFAVVCRKLADEIQCVSIKAVNTEVKVQPLLEERRSMLQSSNLSNNLSNIK